MTLPSHCSPGVLSTPARALRRDGFCADRSQMQQTRFFAAEALFKREDGATLGYIRSVSQANALGALPHSVNAPVLPALPFARLNRAGPHVHPHTSCTLSANIMLHRSPSSPRLSCLRHVCSLCAAPSRRYCTLSARPSQARQSAQDCIRSTVLWSNGGSFEKDFEFAPTKVSVDLFGQALDASNPSNKRLLRYLAWLSALLFVSVCSHA